MKIEVIAYFEESAVDQNTYKVDKVIPKPLKIKIFESEDEAHVFDVKRIIKVDSRAAGKTKYFEYVVEIEDGEIIKQLRVRYYPLELLWSLAD